MSSDYAAAFDAPICQLRVHGPCRAMARAPAAAHGHWWTVGAVPPSCAARRAAWAASCGNTARVDSRVVATRVDATRRQQLLSHEATKLRTRVHLSLCAKHLLGNASLQRHARTYHTPFTPLIEMIYLIHYTPNVRRRAFQLAQLPRLGVPFTIVHGYDGDAVDQSVQDCLLPPRHAKPTPMPTPPCARTCGARTPSPISRQRPSICADYRAPTPPKRSNSMPHCTTPTDASAAAAARDGVEQASVISTASIYLMIMTSITTTSVVMSDLCWCSRTMPCCVMNTFRASRACSHASSRRR